MSRAHVECEYYSAGPENSTAVQLSGSDDVITTSPTSGRPAKLSTNHVAQSDEGAKSQSENKVRTGDASDFFLPDEFLEPTSSANVSEAEEDRRKSIQSRESRIEDVVETTEMSSKLAREVSDHVDDVKCKLAKTLNRRSPEERVHLKGKGDIITSNMPKKSNPRRSHQSKELISQKKQTQTRFEIPSKTDKINAVVPSPEHEIKKSQRPVISTKTPLTSPRPSPPGVIDGTEEAKALDLSRYHDQSGSSNSTTSGDTASHFHKHDERKGDGFPPQLSLEEYQQRGKSPGTPRKTTPRSAVKESLKLEQRFSRMKSAPQRSPPSPRTPDPRESEEVPYPSPVSETNSRPFSRHAQSPSGLDQNAKDKTRSIPIRSKDIEKEEERIQKNIWNNPLTPLPKIGRNQPVIEHSVARNPRTTLNAPSTTDLMSMNSSDEKSYGGLESILSKKQERNENSVVSSENAARVESESIPESEAVDRRPGGLAYFLKCAHEKKNIKRVLPRSSRNRSVELIDNIRCCLKLKDALIKIKLKKIELRRKIRRRAFQSRRQAVLDRRQELICGRRLKIIASIDCKQVKARHNREVIREKRQGRFHLVHERRNKVRERKHMLMEIRERGSKEKAGNDFVAVAVEENLNLPANDVKGQDECIEQQSKNEEDSEIPVPETKGDIAGKENDDINPCDERVNGRVRDRRDTQEENDRTDEVIGDNGCHTENTENRVGEGGSSQAERRVDEDSNRAENIIERLQLNATRNSPHEEINHPEDSFRGTEEEVTKVSRRDTENVQTEDDQSNQEETDKRSINQDSNKSENVIENQQKMVGSLNEEKTDSTRGTEYSVNGRDTENVQIHVEDDRRSQAGSAKRKAGEDTNNSENDAENHQNTSGSANEEGIGSHLHEDSSRGTENREVTNGNGATDTENVQRGDDTNSQAESAQRRDDEHVANSEINSNNQEPPRLMLSEVLSRFRQDPPLCRRITGDPEEDNFQAAFDWEYSLEFEAYYNLQEGTYFPPRSVERQDPAVEAMSYYTVAVRALQDHIEDMTARGPDGSFSDAGVLPIVFEEAVQARGDYPDENAGTTSDTDMTYTDEEFDEMDEEEYVEEMPFEGSSLLRNNENVGSRSRSSNHGY